MAIRNIIQKGDPVLRKKCFEVTDFGPKTHQLLDDMKETLKYVRGVGLAAPQVGVLRRIFIVMIEEDGVYYECINPKILSASGKQVGEEGCLSVSGKQGIVERPKHVKIQAYDRYGRLFTVQADDLLARAFCHENDHLDGILYIDKAKNVVDESND